MIAIIDYGAGNLFGVSNALKQFSEDVFITCDKDLIRNADHVILPGVGSFGDAMGSIKKSGLIETVYEVTAALPIGSHRDIWTFQRFRIML